MITNAMKSAKIQDKLYNFFKFKVCFQYFKVSRQYTCWQARLRLLVSIIARCHWTQEMIFFIGNSHPFLKMHRPRGVYTNKYGTFIYNLLKRLLFYFNRGSSCIFATYIESWLFSLLLFLQD